MQYLVALGTINVYTVKRTDIKIVTQSDDSKGTAFMRDVPVSSERHSS